MDAQLAAPFARTQLTANSARAFGLRHRRFRLHRSSVCSVRLSGIYRALIKIGLTGDASIDKVAGPVGEALIMTAIGLAVAVPAVMGYNWLQRRNKLIAERMGTFATDIHGYMMSGGAVKPGCEGRSCCCSGRCQEVSCFEGGRTIGSAAPAKPDYRRADFQPAGNV